MYMKFCGPPLPRPQSSPSSAASVMLLLVADVQRYSALRQQVVDLIW